MKQNGVIFLCLLVCSCSTPPHEKLLHASYCGTSTTTSVLPVPKISLIINEVAGNDEIHRTPSLLGSLDVTTPYPLELRQQGISGEVTARLSIEKDGTVSNVTVLHSSFKDFEAPVLAGACKLRFLPATRLGSNIPCTINCVFKFDLRDD